MLTESEKQWLQDRAALYHHSCFLCHEQDKRTCRYYCRIHKPYKSELKNAAAFEGRVAARLARQAMKYVCEKYPCRHGRPALGCMRDKTKLTGPFAVHCEDCFLREVRLQVEEEMDEHKDTGR